MSSDTFYAERLHPAGIAILGIAALRDALIPILAVAAVGAVQGDVSSDDLGGAVVLVILGAVGAAVAGAVTWSNTRVTLSVEALQLRTGLLSVKETSIPLERVQALDEVRGPLHRLFGVVRVDVQTAGGGTGGEISLAAVDFETLEIMRRAMSLPVQEVGRTRRLSRGALLVAALTSGSLGVLVPAIAVVPQVFDELLLREDAEEDAGRLLGLAPDSAMDWIAVGGGVVAAAWLLSVLGVIVAFAGFQAERLPDRLVIRRGLLLRRTATVPVGRVQAVRVVEGVLRQPFGLAAVRVEVAGYAAEAAAAQTLFPLLRTSRVPALVAELLPEMPNQLGPLAPAPPRALLRYLLVPSLLAAAAGGAAAVAAGSPLPLLLVLPVAAVRVLAHRAAGWRVDDGRLALRFRKLARTTLLGPLRLTQRHAVRQTPFQRRAGLADFSITLGAGGDGRVRHLEAADAWAVFAAATRR
jgi:putative membrane protein